LTEEDCEIDFWRPKYFTKTQQKHRADARDIKIEMEEGDGQNVEEKSPHEESVMPGGGENKKIPTMDLTSTNERSQAGTFRN
jgi:hypothetical protein